MRRCTASRRPGWPRAPSTSPATAAPGPTPTSGRHRGGRAIAALREPDLPPFAAAIAAGVAAVMPGHLRVAGLTGDRPATQSAAALGGLLRGELGFTG